ncbi:restriction endonuclease subunit S [Clostridiaceae bacterium]|nr:restriction endonuclease subunit S [Clostridiaceae bacterium]
MVPKSAEQNKISSLLLGIDHLITLHQRKYSRLCNIKKSMLEKMFPKDGASMPEIRFAGFTDAWEQRKLGELADIVGGGTPSTGNPEYWDGDIDWYAPAEIADQIYLESSQRKITELGYDSSSAKILPPGTVLFTSRAGIGKTAILARKGCTNQGFQSIVPHKGELDSYFIFSRTEELKRYGELVGAGSTFVEVSGKQMTAMELMIPSTMREQQQIGAFFRHLDHLITLHQRELERLQNIKKACLEKMFV